MDSNIIELVKLGHERADELKAACGAIDVRSVAQLISDLASQLEVQYVRAEESKREFRSADITMQNLEAKCEKLAAENAGLKAFGDKLYSMYKGLETSGGGFHDEQSIPYQQAALDAAMSAFEEIETPATDAFLAEVRAQGVEEFLRGSQLPYQIATVLADYDNADDATLQTVIWSGQPPEPDGDVWHLEYVSRGNAIVRSVLKELRKGVQS